MTRIVITWLCAEHQEMAHRFLRHHGESDADAQCDLAFHHNLAAFIDQRLAGLLSFFVVSDQARVTRLCLAAAQGDSDTALHLLQHWIGALRRLGVATASVGPLPPKEQPVLAPCLRRLAFAGGPTYWHLPLATEDTANAATQ